MASAKAVTGAPQEIVDELEQIKKLIAEIQSSSDEAKRQKLYQQYQEFREKYFRFIEPDDENTDDPEDQPPAPPQDGRPQPEKGGSKDSNTWKVVPMKDDPRLFKIVDDKGINVADLFHLQENAETYIANAKAGQPTTPPAPEPAEPGVKGNAPYPAKGAKMASTTRGPTERHYASGKASDQTIEKNVKEIDYDNYQWVVSVTINQMEHDDTVSLKLGGSHMGTGWFDNSVSIYEGKTGLGIEPDHPTTKLFLVKGPAIGDIRNKKVGIASTYFKKENKTELWTNLGDGWKKQVEGVNVGGFNPRAKICEAQLRIDGFKKGSTPSIHESYVTEI